MSTQEMPTPASSEQEMFAHWKQLASDPSPEDWGEDDLAMFFQRFRSLGVGVEAVFEGVIQREAILARLREVYAATAAGWGEKGIYDFYFVVRDPPVLSRAETLALVQRHLQNLFALNEWSRGPSDEDVREGLESIRDIEVVHGAAPETAVSQMATVLYEFLGDLRIDLKYGQTPLQSHALLMDDAFYTLAADHTLMFHLTWPLYGDRIPIAEPFLPYFGLWKCGVHLHFADVGKLRVHVPKLLDH